MKFGSLFSGIGGLDLGLERAGMSCAWQVEKDEYAQKVLKKHWPTVPRFSDVKDVGRNQLEPVDLIAGGFPCQDISVAGKGSGLAGERSGLWREFRRIVDELSPPWVLVENVPALRTRGLATVLGDLHALGYDAEWDGLPAYAFGAPHRRDRLFIVAYAQRQPRDPRGLGDALEGERGRDSDRGPECSNVSEPVCIGRDPPGKIEGRIFHHINGNDSAPQTRRPNLERGSCGADYWRVEPDVGRVADGVPSRMDRLRGLGNAVVPQVAEYVGRLILAANGNRGPE